MTRFIRAGAVRPAALATVRSRLLLPLRHALRTLLLLAALPALVAAQQDSVEVRGRVLGPSREAVPDQRILLHRVGAGEAANVAETRTGADGEFVLRAAAERDTSVIFFAALMYDGELYMGPMFRAGGEVPGDQVIQVGIPGTSATALLEGGGQGSVIPMGRPATNRNWLLLAIPLLGVAAVAVYALIPRGRIAADRALLISIAEIDERLMTAPPAQREMLASERVRLVTELRTTRA
jgi:hypothetical protein